MDSNPAVSLSFLYRNDPVYSLCASDLMTASQTVNNNFIKEHRLLMKTLRQLERERVSLKRRLEEEKRQFAFLMARRLRPRHIQASSASSSVPSASRVSSCRYARCTRSAPPALLTAQRRGDRGAGSRETGYAAHGQQGDTMTHLCHRTRSLYLAPEKEDTPKATRGVSGGGSSSERKTRCESRQPRAHTARSCPPCSRKTTEHMKAVWK
ncbi:uncharacterized protein LOC134463114 [Engraulis encrasicolus]|uniref:uncharacterized protein LOC134463114 n=1 Tax=Engraulis encrasicolus TaxID=184585 RepID=UPI002FCFA6D3